MNRPLNLPNQRLKKITEFTTTRPWLSSQLSFIENLHLFCNCFSFVMLDRVHPKFVGSAMQYAILLFTVAPVGSCLHSAHHVPLLLLLRPCTATIVSVHPTTGHRPLYTLPSLLLMTTTCIIYTPHKNIAKHDNHRTVHQYCDVRILLLNSASRHY